MNKRASYPANERGFVSVKTLIATAVLAASIYTGIQMVPLYWTHWNFEDKMKTAIQFAFLNFNSQDVKKKMVAEAIKNLDEMSAQYEEKNVKVTVDERSKKIVVEVWYALPHKLPFVTNPKPFYINVSNSPLKEGG